MPSMILRSDRREISGVRIKTWLTVGYDADGDDIEEAVVIELDYSPADPSVGVPEASFDVTQVLYAATGKPVESRLWHTDQRESWEERAAEAVQESIEGERDAADAAMEAKLDARRDGE